MLRVRCPILLPQPWAKVRHIFTRTWSRATPRCRKTPKPGLSLTCNARLLHTNFPSTRQKPRASPRATLARFSPHRRRVLSGSRHARLPRVAAQARHRSRVAIRIDEYNAVASSPIGMRHATCVGLPMVKSRGLPGHDDVERQALRVANASADARALALADHSSVSARELAIKLLTKAALKCLLLDSARGHRPGASIP
jgi:hypothetical protein